LFGGVLIIVGILGCLLVHPILTNGFQIIKPVEARVFTLFGNYYGTVKSEGFYYVNPFCETVGKAKKAGEQSGIVTIGFERKTVFLKTHVIDNERQKVNDILGNPIIIGAMVAWRVQNPTQAVFSVENYYDFLSIQTDSTIRNVARLYPYDFLNENEEGAGEQEKTLRGSALEIAESMKLELQKSVDSAGLIIEEVRITHLAYAEEIAAAMLQRQQAAAIIAARKRIVDGAVGMVKTALDKLEADSVMVLDDERRATMVSNLLVVLCGNRDAQPIINSGSLY